MHEQHHQKSQSQLKFSSRPKFETLVAQVDAGLHGEMYELSLLGGGAHAHGGSAGSEHKKSNSPEPIVDDMTYRSGTRLVAVIDIIYSMVMLIFQLVILIGGSSMRSSSGGDEAANTSEAEHRKMNLTIGVLIWMGMFAICIIQLVVAGALYNGTNERDGRKTLRNCRIWCATSIFLVIILTVEVLGIFASNEIVTLMFPLVVFSSELIFRLIGLVLISRFVKELNFELADSMEDANDVHYEQLCPSPSSFSKTTFENEFPLPHHSSSAAAAAATATASHGHERHHHHHHPRPAHDPTTHEHFNKQLPHQTAHPAPAAHHHHHRQPQQHVV